MVQKSQHNKRFQIGAIFAVVTLAFCTAMAVSASTYAVADVDAASTPAPELENDLLLMPETNEVSMLESTTEVDISATVEAIEQKKEAERIAAEKKREAARKAAEAKRLAEEAAKQLQVAETMPELSLEAGSAILFSVDEDLILYEKSGTDQAVPASTTKLMTALTVLNYCDPAEKMTAGE